MRDPAGPDASGRSVDVRRADLIVGDVAAALSDPVTAVNPTTRVARRFGPSEWTTDGRILTLCYSLRDVRRSLYVRVRGTAGEELEPTADPAGEDPWSDLWFYGNPVFIAVE